MVAYTGLVVAVFTVFGWSIKWLIKQPKVDKQLRRLNGWYQTWWTRNKAETTNMWEFLLQILIDPLFFAYAVYALFNRLGAISTAVAQNPQYKFWQLLDQEMESDPNFYAWFLLIFVVWVVGKSWRYQQQRATQRNITKSLNNIEKKLEELSQ